MQARPAKRGQLVVQNSTEESESESEPEEVGVAALTLHPPPLVQPGEGGRQHPWA